MRCRACNNALSDREATRKGLFSGDYLDLCTFCIEQIPEIKYEENPELSNEAPLHETELFIEEEDVV